MPRYSALPPTAATSTMTAASLVISFLAGIAEAVVGAWLVRTLIGDIVTCSSPAA